MTNPNPSRDSTTAGFLPEYGHFIGGTWVAGDSGKTIPLGNPATGETLAHIAAGNAADAKRAVDAGNSVRDHPSLEGAGTPFRADGYA